MSILRHRAAPPIRRPAVSVGALRARKKFLRFFPRGFSDPKYHAWERGYKQRAHEEWQAQLGRKTFAQLLRENNYSEVAARAVRIESRTNLLFSFEKMALRDALRDPRGARAFAEGLFQLLHGPGASPDKFNRWVDVIASLPRTQSRVSTWPVVTVFGFLADPQNHFYLKPTVTKAAAAEYGYDFIYRPLPSPETYASLLAFAQQVRQDLQDLSPKDMIDIQSFLWVQGSSEYDE